MKAYLIEHSVAAAATLAIPAVAIGWLVMVPATMSAGTFATTAVLAVGAGAIALRTWRSGQATRTIGHVLNDVEAGRSPSDAAARTKI
jgi:hypothetical protein